MSERLLPCAHCGKADPRRVPAGYGPTRTIDVECDRCGASSPESVWNKRIPITPNQQNPGRVVTFSRERST